MLDDALADTFRHTDYRVRLPRGGWASLRIGEPPPTALAALIDGRPWGFITAWNPGSQATPRAINRRAQRHLRQMLSELPGATIHVAIGVGTHWREPSLFVVGADTRQLDALARHAGQLAYVCGIGTGAATLCWM